jgi:hypothetical protein
MLQSVLSQSEGDFVIIMTHYPPGGSCANDEIIADALQADGRPMIGLCGHSHSDASVSILTSTDTLASFNFYKVPAMFESGAWARVVLDWNGSAITVDEMSLQHYTDPGGWTVAEPFTVAA